MSEAVKIARWCSDIGLVYAISVHFKWECAYQRSADVINLS
jgi:hypothetical protein